MERAETRQEPTEHGSGSGELQFEIDRDLIGTVNADGYFRSLNAAWERVLGWSREELMQRPFIDFVHPDDVARTAREALKVDLLAYTQPILDAQGGALVQEELLARVRSPGDGRMIILPEGFVPAAERHGLIGLVDQQMLSEGVRLANRGRYAEVNLSAQSICDESLTLAVERVLIQAGESSVLIVFEITESDAIHHLDAARDFADRMVRLGCRFALDDFGTGYGSLTYLRHLPVRFLKIDTTFVRDLTRSSEDQAMVRSIVAIAKEFGLRTVAEGVEDALTLKLLREYGVHNVQGYLRGRPRPIAETAAAPS